METTISENQKHKCIHSLVYFKVLFPFANFIAPFIDLDFNKEKLLWTNTETSYQFSVERFDLYYINRSNMPSFFIIFATDFISLIETIDHSAGHFSVNNIQNLSGYILLFGLVICCSWHCSFLNFMP